MEESSIKKWSWLLKAMFFEKCTATIFMRLALLETLSIIVLVYYRLLYPFLTNQSANEKLQEIVLNTIAQSHS